MINAIILFSNITFILTEENDKWQQAELCSISHYRVKSLTFDQMSKHLWNSLLSPLIQNLMTWRSCYRYEIKIRRSADLSACLTPSNFRGSNSGFWCCPSCASSDEHLCTELGIIIHHFQAEYFPCILLNKQLSYILATSLFQWPTKQILNYIYYYFLFCCHFHYFADISFNLPTVLVHLFCVHTALICPLCRKRHHKFYPAERGMVHMCCEPLQVTQPTRKGRNLLMRSLHDSHSTGNMTQREQLHISGVGQICLPTTLNCPVAQYIFSLQNLE